MARRQLQQGLQSQRHGRTRFRLGKGFSFLFFVSFCLLYALIIKFWNHHHDLVIAEIGQENIVARNQVSTPGAINKNVNAGILLEQILQNATRGSSSSGKFAYAFLLGGALSTKPGSDYRGGLYSVVVAAHNLRRHNSMADVILMVQLSTTSNQTRLPELEEQVTKALGIQLVYLPKFVDAKFEKFYNLMLEKFRILSLVDYDRILYLDYDVLPLCNLDYILQLSYEGVLKKNVILAHLTEPATGGFFVLTPSNRDNQQLNDIIVNVENRTLHMGFPHWNSTEGWGHTIQQADGDYWINVKGEKGFEWDWYGVQADQGLLYYWTKYVKKSVSIIVKDSIENWEANGSQVAQEGIQVSPLKPYSCRSGQNAVPYREFVHLTGKKKPWHSNLASLEKALMDKTQDTFTPQELWLWLLKDALQSIGMTERVQLDFIRGEVENASVGVTPGNRQRNILIKNKANVHWNQYQIQRADIS